MAEPKVWVFFYGSFINRKVLAEAHLIPEKLETAKLDGFDIRIQPLANVVRSEKHSVYGIVCLAAPEDLKRLYDQDWVGAYLPETVMVETKDGKSLPAQCYIAPHAPPAPAAGDYIDRIVNPAREYEFPDWYIERLEKFRRGPEPD